VSTLNDNFNQPSPEPHNSAHPPASALNALNYLTPQAYSSSAVWARGDRVMANDCTVFPPRCVGCNGNEKLKMHPKQIVWAPPYAYVALLLGLLPGAILVMLMQRKVNIRIATCKHCRRRIAMQQLITLGIVLAAFGALGLGAAVHRYFALGGLAILLAGIVYGVAATRLYRVVSIKDDVVTLKGMGKAFVGSLDQA
jgi:hypothetical protein